MLINCGDKQIFDYVRNFLFDYFNSSDLTIYFIKMDIIDKVKEKNPINIIKNENKIIKTVEKEKNKQNII